MAQLISTRIEGSLIVNGNTLTSEGLVVPSCFCGSYSNANGYFFYRKWSNGFLEQWGTIPLTDYANVNGWSAWAAVTGGYYSAKTFTLPIAYKDINSYSVFAGGDVNSATAENARAMRGTASTFTMEINVQVTTGGTAFNGISWNSLGLWK